MTSTELDGRLLAILRASPIVERVFEVVPSLGLPDWYLAAGSVAGTLWNNFHGYDPSAHIKDLDLIYFDPTDLSYEAEEAVIEAATAVFADLPIPVEVRNEARVHLWYQDHFGYAIEPYRDVEAAIATFPTTATSIGVRSEPDGSVRVAAPFGLDDVFDMVVRPNRVLATRAVYEEKARRWSEAWPNLRIESWSDPLV